MAHLLSIIAVAFNEERSIGKLQTAVHALKRPNDVRVETILIDGGSKDGTVAAARAAGFDRVLILPGASIPVCRNAGLREASGDWIAYLDADCEPSPTWLEEAAYFLEREPLAILGWPAQPPEPMTWVQAAWAFHWAQKNPHWDERHGRRIVVREGFRLSTTRNMILHRAVADTLNGFNEELTTGEDTDFAFRADRAGIPVWGIPGLRVAHHGEPATLGAWFKQQLWHANRKSYKHIAELSGGRVGGNAPRFTALYLATFDAGLLGIALAAILRNPLWLTLIAPWCALIAGPAFLLCARARQFRFFPALCILYAAYGLARSIDLLGLHRAKPSWKAK
ncbi:MAG: glycosyltransferase [Kiritimatiellae bacterium]|nr:glycosyltransferase [Kiritimatiellia bacterium]MCO5069122.1 glycosyltransferase [Kiritimatiellia bacterium]